MKPCIPVSILLLAGLPVAAFGQAAAEAALGTARAAGTTAPAAKAIGKSIGGALDRLGKTLDQGAKAETTTPRPAAAAKPAASQAKAAPPKPAGPPKPAPVYEDPAGITVGMTQAELTRRFGEPAMSITSGAGRQSLSYALPDGSVEVETKDGLVASVRIKRRKPPETAATTPPQQPH